MGGLTASSLAFSGAPNRIINGQMAIDQVNEGAAVASIAADGTYALIDAWSLRVQNRTAFKTQPQRNNTALNTVSPNYYLQFPAGGVSATPPTSAEIVTLRTSIESAFLDIFYPGTQNGKTAVLKFNVSCAGTAGILPVTFRETLTGSIYATLAYPQRVVNANGSIKFAYSVSVPLLGLNTRWALTEGTVGLLIEIAFSNCTSDLVVASSVNTWIAPGAGTFAPGGTLDVNTMMGGASLMTFGDVSLQPAEYPTIARPTLADDLRYCQRYYEKSFSPGVAVQQNVGNSKGAAGYFGQVAGVSNNGVNVPFKVPKAIVTPVMTAYNPVAANANWRNIPLAADSGAAAFLNIGATGCNILNPQVAGDLVGNNFSVHWTADARL